LIEARAGRQVGMLRQPVDVRNRPASAASHKALETIAGFVA